MGNISNAVAVLRDRIEYHTKPGRMLEGLKWTQEPVTEIEGLEDLPALRFISGSFREDYLTATRANPTLTVRLVLATPQSAGLPVHLQWLEKVLDALETTTDGNGDIDPGLVASCAKPFTFTVESNAALSLSWASTVNLTLALRIGLRGRRS